MDDCNFGLRICDVTLASKEFLRVLLLKEPSLAMTNGCGVEGFPVLGPFVSLNFQQLDSLLWMLPPSFPLFVK